MTAGLVGHSDLVHHAADHERADGARGMRRLAVLAVAAVLVVAGALLAALALTRPSQHPPGFTQTVTASYVNADADGDIYAGGLLTGDPVMIRLARAVDVDVEYRFSVPGGEANDVLGEIGLAARVTSAAGYERSVVLEKARSFTGPMTKTGLTTVDFAPLLEQVRAVQRAGGGATGYRIELVPQVEVTATVRDRVVRTTYAPAVSFALVGEQLVLDRGVRAAGAAPVVRGTPVVLAQPSSGATGPRTMSLLGLAQVDVTTARWLGVTLLLAGLLLGLLATALTRRPARRAGSVRDRRGRPAVPVGAVAPQLETVDVDDLAALLDLAERYDRPLLQTPVPGGTAYLVEERDVVYRVVVPDAARAPAQEPVATPPRLPVPAPPPPAPRRERPAPLDEDRLSPEHEAAFEAVFGPPRTPEPVPEPEPVMTAPAQPAPPPEPPRAAAPPPPRRQRSHAAPPYPEYVDPDYVEPEHVPPSPAAHARAGGEPEDFESVMRRLTGEPAPALGGEPLLDRYFPPRPEPTGRGEHQGPEPAARPLPRQRSRARHQPEAEEDDENEAAPTLLGPPPAPPGVPQIRHLDLSPVPAPDRHPGPAAPHQPPPEPPRAGRHGRRSDRRGPLDAPPQQRRAQRHVDADRPAR